MLMKDLIRDEKKRPGYRCLIPKFAFQIWKGYVYEEPCID